MMIKQTFLQPLKVVAVLLAAGLLSANVHAYDQAKNANETKSNTRQYTFAWQFEDGSSLAPRGGSTKGVPIELVTTPTADWLTLQNPSLSNVEKDRAAILAMAGEYRSSFDFIEVGGYQADYKVKAPYQSWGTEKVYVVENTPNKIILQHLLVMFIQGEDGKTIGPFVTKHWRQDWQYEAKEQLVYRGNHTWERVQIPSDQVKGSWLQTVWQVDDSPRYSGVAKWQHLPSYSSWNDTDGWRPLPRREYSVRNDYDVLIGSNRHTITPTGWLHEQRNLKAKVDANGKLPAKDAILATEYGMSRYERIQHFDFKDGDAYMAKTKPLWDAVRTKWSELSAKNRLLTLKGAPDKDQLFLPLFELAEKVAYPEEYKTFVQPTNAALKEQVNAEVVRYLK